MPCYHPWQPGADLGLRPGLLLPCGQCIGCRLQRSADWATRCIHEAKTHNANCWLTLTYDDEHLPDKYFTGLIHPRTGRKIYSGSLNKQDVQKFFRRLRKAFAWLKPLATATRSDYKAIRYYYGGEYGEKYGRPHYHICLFGIDFQDKKHADTTAQDYKLYTSQTITQLWPNGQHMLGELTWETAAYTARYIMKKITGQKQQKHYEKIDQDTGEIKQLTPEYNDMSRLKGIGKEYYNKYHDSLYKREHSHAIINGRQTKVPRYYDKLQKQRNPHYMAQLKRTRIKEAHKHRKDQTPQRLATAEIVTTRKIQSLRQKLEE